MARKLTGTVVYVEAKGDVAGHYRARITVRGGARPWIDLKPSRKGPKAEAKARKRAAELTVEARAGDLEGVKAPARKAKAGSAPDGGGETLEAYAERWLADRKRRGLATVGDDRGRLNKWVMPPLGRRSMTTIGRRDLETVVEVLDGAIARSELSWRTARNVWAVLAKLFDDAANAKTLALRVLETNPAAGVRPPDRGLYKAKAYLYPAEALRFMQCEAVPLVWRRWAACAVYMYLRASELRGLTWDALDVDRGIAHVHCSADRQGDGTKSTKSGGTRRFAVEAQLLPLLRAMHAESGGVGRVVELPARTNLARDFRAMLRLAGIDRAELYADSATRLPIRFHDLRATGLTWMAVRGDDALKIMQRAGHADFATTQLYVREAEAVRDGFGDVFPELPANLLGGYVETRAPKRQADPQSSQPIVPRRSSARNLRGEDGIRTRV